MKRRLVLGCCVLALPCLALARPATFVLDPVHTRVVVAVSHAGFSRSLGDVSGSTGTLVFDPTDWPSASLTVRVPMSSLDFGDPKWNAAVGARNLLDVARFPDATFVSTRVEGKDARHALVCGTLTLRGAGREVCLDVTFNQLKRHPLPPFRRTAGFSATTVLSRKAFGIDAWPTVIGDDIELRIEAEAVRGNASSIATARPGAPVGEAAGNAGEVDGNAADGADVGGTDVDGTRDDADNVVPTDPAVDDEGDGSPP